MEEIYRAWGFLDYFSEILTISENCERGNFRGLFWKHHEEFCCKRY